MTFYLEANGRYFIGLMNYKNEIVYQTEITETEYRKVIKN